MIGAARHNRIRIAIGGAIAALLFIAAGLVPAQARAADPEPIKVGVLLPLTGGVAGYGQMALEGMKLARAMEPKAMGRPIEFFIVDNKGDTTESTNGATRLIQKEKVAAILGPATSSPSMTAGDIAEMSKVPMISPTATNPMVTQGKQYVFRVCFLDSVQGNAAAQYLYNVLGKKKAAVLIDVSQDYAVGLAGYFMGGYRKLGGKIVAVAKFNRDAQDFTAQLSTLKRSGAEVLYLPNYYTEDALVARQAKEMGVDIPMFSGDGAHAPELLQIGGPAVESLMFTAQFNPVAAPNERARAFFKRFNEARAAGKISDDVTAFHVQGADAYFVLRDALDRAKTTDSAKLRQAIIDPAGFEAVTGRFVIGPDGNAIKDVAVLKVKNGKFSYVTDIKIK